MTTNYERRVSDAARDHLPGPVANALDHTTDVGRYNEQGHYEEVAPDGRLVVVKVTSEGIIADWFKDGEPDGTWATDWADIEERTYEVTVPVTVTVVSDNNGLKVTKVVFDQWGGFFSEAEEASGVWDVDNEEWGVETAESQIYAEARSFVSDKVALAQNDSSGTETS